MITHNSQLNSTKNHKKIISRHSSVVEALSYSTDFIALLEVGGGYQPDFEGMYPVTLFGHQQTQSLISLLEHMENVPDTLFTHPERYYTEFSVTDPLGGETVRKCIEVSDMSFHLDEDTDIIQFLGTDSFQNQQELPEMHPSVEECQRVRLSIHKHS